MASYNHSHFHCNNNTETQLVNEFSSCNNTVTQLLNEFSSSSLVNVTRGYLQNLMHFCVMGCESQANEKYSIPLVWIGVYIAIASLFCTVAMGADIFYRLFVKDIVPSKYFSLNATSITVISIAMKLSLDMTVSMPGVLDQVAKLGGLAFMCTMMANLIPSLGSMDNKTLVENLIGLAILVITIIGNISVEIYTGVIGDHMCSRFRTYLVITLTFWYVAMMLLLLLVSISTAIIIPPTKKILEFKYQVRRKALNDQRGLHQRPMFFSQVELKNHVTRYWIMAKSGSPQFIMAGTSLAYTSTLICVINAGLLCALIFSTLNGNIRSDYGVAIRIILVIQFVGTKIGTLALVSRCITSFSFRYHRMVVVIRGYSTQKLSEWKLSRIAFLSSGRRTRAFVQIMKNFIVSLCFGLHIAVFALCRITGSLFEYFHVTLRKFTTPQREYTEEEVDRINYVLYIEDFMRPSQRALKGLQNSMDRMIENAEKQQNNNILELLRKSQGFEGVKDIDSDQVQDLPYIKLNSWSLPVATLACIAIVVPGISEDEIDRLIDAVDEALWYTHLVEESFNSADEYENIRNTMRTVWDDVKENRKWLENPMQRGQHGEAPIQILDGLTNTAGDITAGIDLNDELYRFFPIYGFIAAHSMSCISSTIKSKYQSENELSTNDLFFQLIQRMIADILCACLTNIPQVIIMKCHSDAIEKLEPSVVAAVKLLGRSTNILRHLEFREPEIFRTIGPERMASIDEWRRNSDHWYQSRDSSSLPSR